MTDIKIYLKEYIDNKIVNSKFLNEDDFIKAISMCSKNTSVDMVTFYNTKKIVFYNVTALEVDKNGRYFYEINVSKTVDMIDNINLESGIGLRMELTYYIGSYMFTYDELSEILLCAIPYNQVKMRVTFVDKPKMDDEFEIKSRHHVFSLEHRYFILHNSVYNKNIIYKNGVCNKI